MKPFFLLLIPTLGIAGCTSAVTHQTKSKAEMLADIKRCKAEAIQKVLLQTSAAVYHAWDCLEAMGYSYPTDQSKKISPRPPAAPKPSGPCRVPCIPTRGS